MIELLIKSGAQVDAINRRSHTAYVLADRDIDHLLQGVETKADNRPGCSALHEAVAEGKTTTNDLHCLQFDFGRRKNSNHRIIHCFIQEILTMFGNC